MSATLHCCITPERERKTARIMNALVGGQVGAQISWGAPPDDPTPFVVWGQAWLARTIVPRAIKISRPWFHVDNGFVLPAGGGVHGYYRITYRGLSPILITRPPPIRQPLSEIKLRPWREPRDRGDNILLALPGRDFGLCLGLDMRTWIAKAQYHIRQKTKRRIVIRDKGDPRPLGEQLRGCWALVTHSSNVAVDAVMAGVPVFVAPTSPAAPVGRTDLELESPIMPDREHWWASLMAQQFTLQEMYAGVACAHMHMVRAQVGY
jgi:hypothetical protein